MLYLTSFQEGRRCASESVEEWSDEEKVLGRSHMMVATMQLIVALSAAWGLILGCM